MFWGLNKLCLVTEKAEEMRILSFVKCCCEVWKLKEEEREVRVNYVRNLNLRGLSDGEDCWKNELLSLTYIVTATNQFMNMY